MTAINQLTAVDEVFAADQVPIYSSTNGDARKASMTVIAALVASLVTPPGEFLTQYAAPNASAFSITIDPPTDGDSMHLLVTPTATFAAGTVVLPIKAECEHGQEMLVTTTQIITALTVSGNGATVNGAPTTMAANAFFKLRYDGVLAGWYRIG